MDATETPLTDLGNAIMNDLIASMHQKGRVKSGNTVNQIQMTVTPTRMYIVGPNYLFQLEKGRHPTGAGGPVDRQRYGGLSFADSIKLWVAAVGLPANVWYPIYKTINEKGFPGTPGLITGPLSDDKLNANMDKYLNPLGDLYAHQVYDVIFNK